MISSLVFCSVLAFSQMGGGIFPPPIISMAEAVPYPVSEVPSVTSAEQAFRFGESLKYDVSVGLFGRVGEGLLAVLPQTETIRGIPSYHLKMTVNASTLLGTVKVRNRYDSWLGEKDLISRRFRQVIQEPGYQRNRLYDFYPDRQTMTIDGSTAHAQMSSHEPLDELSFLYFIRTQPLEVGQSYTYNRYFKESGNPIRLNVLRREAVKVPAGEFQTIVVQPIIQTSGLFGEGGSAEVYFTDDERRLLVLMKVKIPILKTMEFRLKEIDPGFPG